MPAGVDPALAALLLESPPGIGTDKRAVIRALVVGAAANNVLQLLSAEGKITVRSPAAVAIGSVVVLEIDAARRRAHILSVQPGAKSALLPAPAPVLLIDAPAALGTRRDIVRATVTAHAAGGAVLDTAEGKVTVRSVVPLPLGSVVVLGTDGAQRQASILSIQPPGRHGTAAATLVQAPPALAGGTTVAATVAQHAKDGTVVLQGAAGAIVIRTPSPPPVGSRVELVVDGARREATILSVQPPAQPAAAAAASGAGSPERLLLGWPALTRALGALAAQDPVHAAIAMNEAVARPGGRLADAMLRWAEALSDGDGAHAFGAATWAAVRDALADDFAAARTLAAPNAEGWRGFPIPLHDGRGLGVLALMVRGEPPRAEGAAPQRLAIQFTLRRLGEVRIEALARYRRLDLLVRSAEALPPPVVSSLETLFTGAKGAFGYGGTLHFRVGPLPMIILGPAPPAPHDVMLV